VCGDTAVTTIDSTVGTTTGPPAESEYAVDPVGVEITTPSAPYAPIGSPSIDTSNRTTRAKPPLCSTTSFSERQCIRSRPVGSTALARSAMRGSA
jgi:hypothetical protein